MPEPSVKWFENRFKTLLKRHSSEKTARVVSALHFEVNAHGSQKRVSGEAYWTHPANVALILAEMGADPDSVCAALLHDVLEDTDTAETALRREFGDTVLELVKGVTKINLMSKKKHDKFRQAKNIQKVFMAAAGDLRVMVVKLADKIHNLRTLQFSPREKQIRIASETLQVYVPLAHKLGMHEVMHELEDLAFGFVDPKKFRQLKKKIEAHKQPVVAAIQKMMPKIKSHTRVSCKMEVYHKSIFSVYSKLKRGGKPLSELYDCAILSIIVPATADCYSVLGDVHRLYPPLPSRFKDFIGIPNANLYRALHTAVVSDSGKPVKVYISSERMDEVNRKGIIAVTDSEKSSLAGFNERIRKLNKLFKLPEFSEEADDFFEVLELDLLPQTVFVFTPKGDIVELQFGSTPIDFAFKVNPNLGRHVWRAKVNGHFVPLHHALASGDIVEIVPSRIVQASPQWLSKAKTVFTKKQIESVLKKKRFVKYRSVDINVWMVDKIGNLLQTSSVFTKEKINLAAFLANTGKKKASLLQFNVPNYSYQKIHKLVSRLKQIDGVQKIEIQKH